MTTIVTRSGKGSPLTHTEVDTNFTNLNTAKLETAAIPLGTLQAPSVSFLNDSDTGIFCPQGGNSLAIATGGQYAITCSSTQAVGIKTANPQGALQVAGSTRIGANDATDAFLEIGEGATGNRNSYIDIVGDTTYTDYGLRVIRNNTGANATSELKHRGTGALNFTTEEAAPIVFYTTNSPSMTITSGGLVGIGTSSPGNLLHVESSFSGTLAKIKNNAGSTSADTALEIESSTTAAKTFLVKNAGTERFYVKGDGTSYFNGSVGIGSSTFSLDSKLKVKQSSGVYSYNGLWVERLSDESGIGLGYDTASDCFALTTTYGSTGAYKGIAFITSGFERGRWDTSGRFLVGTSTYRTVGTYGYEAKTQIEGTSSVVAGLTLTGNRNDGLGPYFVLGRSRGTTAGSSTAVQNGDELGTIQFCGADGTDLETAGALIRAEVDGTATINAGSFVASRRYYIATVGTTDFTAIGASANTVGVIFTATGVGAGTGTATSEPYANSMPGRLVFATTPDNGSSPTERMRITNGGDFYFNCTVATKTTEGFRVENSGQPNVSRGTAGSFMQFFHAGDGSQIGSISNSGGAATAYNTSSDYRLKENVTTVTDGIARLQQLKPSRFNFKVDPDHTVDGFLAHEVQTVVPEAITGTKDAVDDDGNPVYQGIDQSKLVPLLTAALQEAIGEIESLKARLTAAGI
jgi:hypothetical protein